MLNYNGEKMYPEKINHIHITIINNRSCKLYINTPSKYTKVLKDYKDVPICEDVGLENQQVKPYFDIDAYDNDIDIESVKNDIHKMFPGKPIYHAMREPREYNGKTKYSHRFYVGNVRISNYNIKKLMIEHGLNNNKIYDTSVYDKNRVLFTPLTTLKNDGNKHPPLKPVDSDIFDCSASYILEEYEDWDIKFQVDGPPPKANIKQVIEEDNDDDETPDKYNRLSNLIKLVKPERSDCFDSWIKLNWCIINICNKENISRRKCYDLIHQFSKISKTNYDENKVDDWIDKNYDKIRETGYGWTYLLHTVIKEDDPKYYENFSQSYFNMKKEFEKTNTKILYPPMIIHKDRDGENIIQPIPLCEKTNRHLKCYVTEENKKGEIVYKNKKFIELWLDDPRIRKYEKYVFKPSPLKVEDYEYNTWTDLEITKTPYIQNDDVINRFLEYMKNLFNDERVVNYILAYFANRIQNPAVRNKVCIILYGEEGDGKNRLFDIFKNIFGNKYFTELESAKQLFGAHSCIEKEKLFICVNEAKGKDNYENSDILKARITTDKIIVNPKGIQEFQISNYCDYVMTTNNNNAVNLHDKSRRYLYVETTSYYSRNSNFFNSFSNDIVDNEGSLRVIYQYLKNFNVNEIIPSGNFQNHIPETEIQKEIIKNNRDKILYFLEDTIEKYKDIETEPIKVHNQVLYDNWNEWITKNKVDIKYNNIAFHTRLALLIKKKINTDDNVLIRKDTNKNTLLYQHQLVEFFKKLNNDPPTPDPP